MSRQAPTLAARLRRGETVVGAWSALGSIGVAEHLAAGPIDYVVIDLQHGYASEGDLPLLFAAIEARGAAPAARLRANDPLDVNRVLDLGAHMVIVPNVDTADEAARAVAASRYPPRGARSAGARRGMLSLEDVEDVAIVVQIESATAVASIESIVGVEGLAGVYVGPSDLSYSLGVSRDDPAVAEAIATVRRAVDAAGLPAGVHSLDGAGAARLLAAGWRLVAIADDITLIRAGVDREAATAKGRAT